MESSGAYLQVINLTKRILWVHCSAWRNLDGNPNKTHPQKLQNSLIDQFFCRTHIARNHNRQCQLVGWTLKRRVKMGQGWGTWTMETNENDFPHSPLTQVSTSPLQTRRSAQGQPGPPPPAARTGGPSPPWRRGTACCSSRSAPPAGGRPRFTSKKNSRSGGGKGGMLLGENTAFLPLGDGGHCFLETNGQKRKYLEFKCCLWWLHFASFPGNGLHTFLHFISMLRWAQRPKEEKEGVN